MRMDRPADRVQLWLLLLFAHLALVLSRPGESCPRPCSCQQRGEVHCTFRSLMAVPTGIPRQVERMNLGFNTIGRITDTSLAGLRKLELLMMHGNDIHNIPDGAFQDLSSLQMLKLSYNKLRELRRGALRGLWSLARLHLDQNRLESIDPDAFQGLMGLRLVQLEGNRLQQLHPNTFCTFSLLGHFPLSTLRHLHLADNALRSLSPAILQGAPNLETLTLQGNPWSCDCNMRWFRGWSQKAPGVMKCKKDRAYEGGQLCPLCSFPTSLRQKELQELEDLTCSAPVIISADRTSVPEDTESEVTPSEEFRPALGNVSLGLTDEHGNKVNLDCSVREQDGSTQVNWSQLSAGGGISANVSFTVDLECPIDRGNYERLWRLIAYYSDVPAHLQREVMLEKEPNLSYRYRQDPERDALYFTGVRASVKAQPSWVMQPEMDLQLNRRRSTGKLVRLLLSARTTQHLEPQEARAQNRPWVLINNHNRTRAAVTAVVGQPVVLDCSMTSSDNPVVEWVLPDGSRVEAPHHSADGRLMVSESGELSLREVEHGDTGLYYCVAHVTGDFSVLPFRLSVEESSSPPPGGEGVTAPLSGFASERVTLPCEASGSPEAEYHWILPDGQVVSPHSDAGSRALLTSNGSLVLPHGQLSDNGYYKCVAISAHGVDVLATKLTLARRPGRPLQRPPVRPQGAKGVSTRVRPRPPQERDKKGDEEDVSGDGGAQDDEEEEELPVRRGVTPLPRRRVKQGGEVRGGGGGGGHPTRNSWRRPGMQRRPIRPGVQGNVRGSAAPPQQTPSRRRMGMSNNQIDPERWANILAKVRDRTRNTTPSPPVTTTELPRLEGTDEATTFTTPESISATTEFPEEEEEEEKEVIDMETTPQPEPPTTDIPLDYPEEDQSEEPTTPEPTTESAVDLNTFYTEVHTTAQTIEPPLDLEDTEEPSPDSTTESPIELYDTEEQNPEFTTEPSTELYNPEEQNPELTTESPIELYDNPNFTTQPPLDLYDQKEQKPDFTTELPLDIRSLYAEEQTHVIYQISEPDTDTDLFTESTHTLQRWTHTLEATDRPVTATGFADVISTSPADAEDLSNAKGDHSDAHVAIETPPTAAAASATQRRRTHTSQGQRKHTPQDTHSHTHTTQARNRHTGRVKDTDTSQTKQRYTTQNRHRQTTQVRNRQTAQEKERLKTQDGHRHTTQSGQRLSTEDDQKQTMQTGQSTEGQLRETTLTGQEEQGKAHRKKSGQRLATETDQRYTTQSGQEEKRHPSKSGQRLATETEQTHTTQSGQGEQRNTMTKTQETQTDQKLSTENDQKHGQRHTGKSGQRRVSTEAEQRRTTQTGQRVDNDRDLKQRTQSGQRVDTETGERQSSQTGQRVSTKHGQKHTERSRSDDTEVEETQSTQMSERVNTKGDQKQTHAQSGQSVDERKSTSTGQRVGTETEERQPTQTSQRVDTETEERQPTQTSQRVDTETEERQPTQTSQRVDTETEERQSTQTSQRVDTETEERQPTQTSQRVDTETEERQSTSNGQRNGSRGQSTQTSQRQASRGRGRHRGQGRQRVPSLSRQGNRVQPGVRNNEEETPPSQETPLMPDKGEGKPGVSGTDEEVLKGHDRGEGESHLPQGQGERNSEGEITTLQLPMTPPTTTSLAVNPYTHLRLHQTPTLPTTTLIPRSTLGSITPSSNPESSSSSSSPSSDPSQQGRGFRRRGGRRRRPGGRVRNRLGGSRSPELVSSDTQPVTPASTLTTPIPSPTSSSSLAGATAASRPRIEISAQAKSTMAASPDSAVPLAERQTPSSGRVSHRQNTGSLSDAQRDRDPPLLPPPLPPARSPASKPSKHEGVGREPHVSTTLHQTTASSSSKAASGEEHLPAPSPEPFTPSESESGHQDEFINFHSPAESPEEETHREPSAGESGPGTHSDKSSESSHTRSETSHTHIQTSHTHRETSHTHTRTSFTDTRVNPHLDPSTIDDLLKPDRPRSSSDDDITIQLPAAPRTQHDITGGSDSQNPTGGQTNTDKGDQERQVTVQNPTVARGTGTIQAEPGTIPDGQTHSKSTSGAEKTDPKSDKEQASPPRRDGVPKTQPSRPSHPNPTNTKTTTTTTTPAAPILRPHAPIHPDTSSTRTRAGTMHDMNQIKDTHRERVPSPDMPRTHSPNPGQTHTHTAHNPNPGQINPGQIFPEQTHTHTAHRPNSGQTYTHTAHSPNPGQIYPGQTHTHTASRPNPGQTHPLQTHTHTAQSPNPGRTNTQTVQSPHPGSANTGQTHTQTVHSSNPGLTYTNRGHTLNLGQTNVHTQRVPSPDQTNVDRERAPGPDHTGIHRDRVPIPDQTGIHRERVPVPERPAVSSDPRQTGSVFIPDSIPAKRTTPAPPVTRPVPPTRRVPPPQVPSSGGTIARAQSPAVPALRGRPQISSTGVSTVTVPAEADAHLPCVSSGEPRPFLSWTKVSTGASVAQNTRIQRFEVYSNGTLVIRNTLPSDRGQYMCNVQNQYGEDRAVVSLVVLSEHPRVQNPRYRDATVHMGAPVDLECQAKGHPSPRITWVLPDRGMVHTGALASTGTTAQRVVLFSNGTLHISQTSYPDRGIYKCIASNAAGADSVTVRLHVSALPPTILQGRHDNVSLPEGSTAYLHCSAQGAPPPAIRWTTPDNTQLRPSQFVTGRNLFVFPNGTLFVRSLGPADNGRYECAATNAVGAAWRAISLAVIPAVASLRARITFSSPQNTQVGYGAQLRLDCMATGDPEPRIIWRTPSKKLVDAQYSYDPRLNVLPNGTLVLYPATENDEGDYLCVARNKMGDDYILLRVAVVTKPAKIEQKLTASQEVTYGSDLRVDCVASGLPNPKIQWALPDGTMVNSIMTFNPSSSGPSRSRRYVVFDNGTLYFNEVGMREEGDYTCYADNQVGKDEMKIRVKVVADAPIIRNLTQGPVRVLYGESASLRCEAKGEPIPTVLWFSPASRTIPASSDKYRIHSDGTLVIQKVQRLDGGNYTCLARNSAGQARQVTRLEVLVSPPAINGLRGVANSMRVRAMRDQRKLLDCETTGMPVPRVMWVLPDNVVLPAPYYGSRMTVHRNGTLEIRGLKRSDSAQLACVARNEGGEARLQVLLEVQDPEERLPPPPLPPPQQRPPLPPTSQQIPKTETRPLTLGGSVQLNCSLAGFSPSLLTWVLPNGSPLTSGGRFNRFYHRPDGTLVISNPSLSEGGVYRCLARNAGTGALMEQSVALVPGRAPEISSRYNTPISILNGASLQLHCQARDGATMRLSWTLPSGVVLTQGQRAGRYAVLPNGTLSITQASVYDRGSYVCRAANEFGSASLTVPVIIITYAPRITSGPGPSTQARRGVAVQLNCAATGLPRPEIAWETPDRTRLVVSPQPRLFGNKYIHPQGALIIQNPSPRDSGFYRCTARNVIGVDSKGTYLQVL